MPYFLTPIIYSAHATTETAISISEAVGFEFTSEELPEGGPPEDWEGPPLAFISFPFPSALLESMALMSCVECQMSIAGFFEAVEELTSWKRMNN